MSLWMTKAVPSNGDGPVCVKLSAGTSAFRALLT